ARGAVGHDRGRPALDRADRAIPLPRRRPGGPARPRNQLAGRILGDRNRDLGSRRAARKALAAAQDHQAGGQAGGPAGTQAMTATGFVPPRGWVRGAAGFTLIEVLVALVLLVLVVALLAGGLRFARSTWDAAARLDELAGAGMA